MQPAVVEFFVRLLTEPKDLVLDPFAGSNTTGRVAERLGRRWLGIELNGEHVEPSHARFQEPSKRPPAKRLRP